MPAKFQRGIREYTGSLDNCWIHCFDGSVWKNGIKVFPSYADRVDNMVKAGLLTEDHRAVCAKCESLRINVDGSYHCAQTPEIVACSTLQRCPIMGCDKPPVVDQTRNLTDEETKLINDIYESESKETEIKLF